MTGHRFKGLCKTKGCLSEGGAVTGYCQYCQVVRSRPPRRSQRGTLKWGTYEASRARKEQQRLALGIPRCPEVCEIIGCGRRATCLDHDHLTGKIRGWLCQPCNTALGKFGDNVEGLLNAIAYLRREPKENDDG